MSEYYYLKESNCPVCPGLFSIGIIVRGEMGKCIACCGDCENKIESVWIPLVVGWRENIDEYFKHWRENTQINKHNQLEAFPNLSNKKALDTEAPRA